MPVGYIIVCICLVSDDVIAGGSFVVVIALEVGSGCCGNCPKAFFWLF